MSNLRILLGLPYREKRPENLFEEIIVENFSNLRKETDIQIQEIQRTTNKINQGGPHQDKILKWQENSSKQRILKAAREEKTVTYKGNLKVYQLSADFSAEAL